MTRLETYTDCSQDFIRPNFTLCGIQRTCTIFTITQCIRPVRCHVCCTPVSASEHAEPARERRGSPRSPHSNAPLEKGKHKGGLCRALLLQPLYPSISHWPAKYFISWQQNLRASRPEVLLFGLFLYWRKSVSEREDGGGRRWMEVRASSLKCFWLVTLKYPPPLPSLSPCASYVQHAAQFRTGWTTLSRRAGLCCHGNQASRSQ